MKVMYSLRLWEQYKTEHPLFIFVIIITYKSCCSCRNFPPSDNYSTTSFTLTTYYSSFTASFWTPSHYFLTFITSFHSFPVPSPLLALLSLFFWLALSFHLYWSSFPTFYFFRFGHLCYHTFISSLLLPGSSSSPFLYLSLG